MQNIMPGYKIISKSIPQIALLGLIRCLAWMFIFAADVCYAEKVAQEKGFLYRLTSRYRHYAAFERATFEQGKSTKLMMLTDKQIADFRSIIKLNLNVFKFFLPVFIRTENTVSKSQTAVKFIARKMA